MAEKKEEAKAPVVVQKSGLPLIKIGLAAILLIILIAAAVFGYRYFILQQQLKSTVSLSSDPKQLVSQVGKLIQLPIGEQPTIATVSDVSKLQGQSFFANAENGDKVLIYKKAKKAILYRPSSGKIIDVGPVNIEPPTPAASSSGALQAPTTKPIDVAIYNGTKRAGLTKAADAQLTDKDPSITVVKRDNSTNDYKATVVIDLSGKQKDRAAAIAKIVGGKVTPLPDGEATPSADILVILGDDYKTP